MSEQETKKEKSVKDVMLGIQDIYIPLSYLPSKIRIPTNFVVARITWEKRHTIPNLSRKETYYFLLSTNTVIDMREKELYYRTKAGKVYRIPLTGDELPKQLSKYVPSVDMLIISERKVKGTIVDYETSVLVNFNLITTLNGDIEAVNTEKFLASLLFNLYDDIIFYWKN
jgi:hypothetical protein